MGATQVIGDVGGYFIAATGDRFVPAASPIRLVDTRPGTGTKYSGDTLHQGAPLKVIAAGQDGIPAGVSALAANFTVTRPTANSFLTVWPTGITTVPNVSDLNFATNQTIANFDLTKLGATDGGFQAVNTIGSTDLIVDVGGWYQH